MGSLTLRPYQASAIQSLRISLAGGSLRQMLYSPTGSGKTEIGMSIIKGAVAKGKRVVFLCNRINLVGQASKRFYRAGIDHGVIQGDNTRNIDRPVIVASIQTVARRGMPDCDLIVIDEAHGVAGSKDFRQVIITRSAVPVIGLSATPFSKGLGKHYDQLGGALFESLTVATSIQELIDDGFLVDCEIYAPSEPDMTGIKQSKNAFGEMDWADSDVGRAVDKPQLIGDIVEHWLKLSNGLPTVCFASNIAHSKHIVESFRAAGVAAEHIDCYTSEEERAEILSRVETGDTTIISNVGILTEGWDFPACRTMILARPTRSLIRYIQMIGRSIRIHDNISECYASYRSYRDGIQGSYAVENGRLSGEHRGGSCCFEMRGSEKVVIPTLEQSERILFDKEGARIPANIQPREGQGGARELPYGDYSRGELQRSPASCDGMAEGGKRDPSGESQGWEQAEQSRRQSGVGYESGKQETRASAWVVPGDQWRESRQEQANAGSGDRNKAGIEGLSSWIIDETGTKVRSADDNHIGDKGWKVLGACFIAESQEEVESLAKLLSRCHKGNEALLVCSSTENTGRAVRVVGARRLKKKALVLDHSGTVQRLGFPTDDFDLELDDGKPKDAKEKKPEAALPKKCPECHHMKPPKVSICPKCGFKASRTSEVEEVDGELQLLKKGQKKFSQNDKQKVYSELLAIKLAKGYSDGWINHKYKAYFGVWPKGMQPYALEPSPEIKSWIISQNIRFAKSQEVKRAA